MRKLFHDEIDRLNRLHEGDGWRPCPRLSVFTFLQASLQSVLFFSGLTKHGMNFARQYELVQSSVATKELLSEASRQAIKE